uniref:Putative secreted protein n=1 Tax=Anopheles marajoara TaxID=58244 RepID=A0A2M4CA22_9DIPT
MSLKVSFLHLTRKLVVLRFLFRLQCVPPFAKNLADGAIVLIRVLLMYQGPVALRKDHERIHWSPNFCILLAQRARRFLRGAGATASGKRG